MRVKSRNAMLTGRTKISGPACLVGRAVRRGPPGCRILLTSILLLGLHACGPSSHSRSPTDASLRDAASRDGSGTGDGGAAAAEVRSDSLAMGTGETVAPNDASVDNGDTSGVETGPAMDAGAAVDSPAASDGGAGLPDTAEPEAMDSAPDESEDAPPPAGKDGGADGAVFARMDTGTDAGNDRGDAAAKDAAADRADGSAATDGALDEGGDSGDSGEVGDSTPCCGCLCRDPSWSCSADTCVDETGHAVVLTAEAGFFELAGGAYVAEGQARVSPGHRIWYSFHPATVTPESKPLAVFFNGGPGSATSAYLFDFNTGPWTLDPAATGAAQIVANANSWTQFANLLHIDAPGTGFSYPMSLDGGVQPSVGIDLDRDAADVIRVIVRFLDRHIPLQSNFVILVGESYGGTRATLMIDRLLNYQLLADSSTTYQDSGLYNDLLQHFSAVFPLANPKTLSHKQIASQFGHQVLIQPVVAGQTQWSLNTPDSSVCVTNYDHYQCDQPAGWVDQQAAIAASHLTTIAILRQALGVDPTSIAWLHASARTRAYGRGTGTIVDTPEMTATFGTLGPGDNYFVTLNTAVALGYSPTSRWWLDPTIGVSFLNDVLSVNTFITNARLDMVVWAPAIPPALAQYTSLVSSSIQDTAPRSGIPRAGWIELNYLPSVTAAPFTREVRFPYYAQAGHTVSMRAPADLLADVMQWYANTPTSPVAPHDLPISAESSAGVSAVRDHSQATVLSSQPRPFLGP